MTKPRKPAPAPIPDWATTVIMPTLWTPEQALAVFELLDDLRERLWSLYGRQIQALLRDQQSSGNTSTHAPPTPADDRSF